MSDKVSSVVAPVSGLIHEPNDMKILTYWILKHCSEEGGVIDSHVMKTIVRFFDQSLDKDGVFSDFANNFSMIKLDYYRFISPDPVNVIQTAVEPVKNSRKSKKTVATDPPADGPTGFIANLDKTSPVDPNFIHNAMLAISVPDNDFCGVLIDKGVCNHTSGDPEVQDISVDTADSGPTDNLIFHDDDHDDDNDSFISDHDNDSFISDDSENEEDHPVLTGELTEDSYEPLYKPVVESVVDPVVESVVDPVVESVVDPVDDLAEAVKSLVIGDVAEKKQKKKSLGKKKSVEQDGDTVGQLELIPKTKHKFIIYNTIDGVKQDISENIPVGIEDGGDHTGNLLDDDGKETKKLAKKSTTRK